MNDDENRRSLQLPDRRKNTYEELEKRLDAHIGQIEKRVESWVRRGLIAFAVIGLCCTLALLGFGYLLRNEANTAQRLCDNQNKRHDNAITVLMVGSDQDQANAPTEAAKAEVRRRRDVTVGLLDSVAPKVDCEDPGTVKLIQPQIPAPPLPPTPTPTPMPTETP